MTHPSKLPDGVSAFTSRFDGLALKLINTVDVVGADATASARAQWDTGATVTCLSKDIVDRLGLIPTGKKIISTPSGSVDVNTYAVDLILPNNVRIADLMVCDSMIGDQGIDVLIGMDVIIRGDFAVSCNGGKTCFTFRVPSVEHADYVKDVRIKNAMGSVHGSGKRKRKKR